MRRGTIMYTRESMQRIYIPLFPPNYLMFDAFLTNWYTFTVSFQSCVEYCGFHDICFNSSGEIYVQRVGRLNRTTVTPNNSLLPARGQLVRASSTIGAQRHGYIDVNNWHACAYVLPPFLVQRRDAFISGIPQYYYNQYLRSFTNNRILEYHKICDSIYDLSIRNNRCFT